MGVAKDERRYVGMPYVVEEMVRVASSPGDMDMPVDVGVDKDGYVPDREPGDGEKDADAFPSGVGWKRTEDREGDGRGDDTVEDADAAAGVWSSLPSVPRKAVGAVFAAPPPPPLPAVVAESPTTTPTPAKANALCGTT